MFFSVLYCETKNSRVEVWGDGPTDCTIRLIDTKTTNFQSHSGDQRYMFILCGLYCLSEAISSPHFFWDHIHRSSGGGRDSGSWLGLGKVGVLVLERSGTWAWLRRLRRLRFQFFYIGMHASIHRYIYIHIIIMMVNINHNIIISYNDVVRQIHHLVRWVSGRIPIESTRHWHKELPWGSEEFVPEAGRPSRMEVEKTSPWKDTRFTLW